MRRTFLILPFLLAALAGCTTSAADRVSVAAGNVDELGGTPVILPASAVTTPSQAGYRIGPLDTLDVTVFQVPDLTRTVMVGENGMVSLPLIGNLTASGKTTDELRAQIATAYSKTYLQNPRVDVVVKIFGSQRVTIEGSVAKPGIYPMLGTTTLLQGVALAGGLDRAANPRGIVVFRTVDNQRVAAKFDLQAIRAGRTNDPVLLAGDVVVVDQSGAKAAYRTVLESIPLVGVFGAVLGQ